MDGRIGARWRPAIIGGQGGCSPEEWTKGREAARSGDGPHECVGAGSLFLFLLVLEPVVTFVLGALALLGVLTALFWKFFGPPNFPFFLMLGISLGFELALIVYRKLLRLLA